MKIVDLIKLAKDDTKVEELNEIIENNTPIEDIGTFLMINQEIRYKITEMLFKNDQTKEYVIKQTNRNMVQTLYDIYMGKSEVNEAEKAIYENYMKDYFKIGIEIDCDNSTGRDLIKTIRILSRKKLGERKETQEFFRKAYVDNDVWSIYIKAIKKMVDKIKEKESISNDEMIEYDKTLEYYFDSTIPGYNIKESETVLKLIEKNPNLDISKIKSLDALMKAYKNSKDGNNRRVKEDEIVSVILDYEDKLKGSGSNKKLQYSIIEEMNQKIDSNTYGKINEKGETIISKKEFAYALKIIENPTLANYDTLEKLRKIFDSSKIEIQIGRREIKKIIENQEIFYKMGGTFPNLQDTIIHSIDNYIKTMLDNIENRKDEITQEEKDIISKYLNVNFKISLDKNYETEEMAELICQIRGMVYPNSKYNLINISDKKDTVQFFQKEYTDSKIFNKYINKIYLLSDKMTESNGISKEEFRKYDNIFKKISYIFNRTHKNFTGIMKKIYDQSIQLGERSKTIENVMELYVHESSIGIDLRDIVSKEGCLILLSYYQDQLRKSAKDINENSAVMHFIRAAQKGVFSEIQSKYIIQQLEERNKNVQIPDMRQYDAKVESFEEMTQEEYNEFIEQISEIRLQQGKMPQKYSDYIIRHAITSEENSGIVERALEDMAENELEDMGIQDYSVRVEEQEFFGKKTTTGNHSVFNTNKIYLSRDGIKNNGNIFYISTIAHECTHAEQYLQTKTEKMNGSRYMMLKESIVKEENPGFYSTNYKYMFEEIEARIQGYLKRAKILKRMGFSQKEIMEFDVGNLKQKIINSCEEKKIAKDKVINDKKENIDMIFLETLQNNPELIEQYETLKFEYENVDGKIQRRSCADILKTYEEQLNQTEDKKEIGRISNLFSKILFNDTLITEEKKQEELEQLLQMNSDNKIVNAFRDKLIKTQFPQNNLVDKLTESLKMAYESTSATQREEVSKDLGNLRRNPKDKIQDETLERGK